MTMFKLSSFHYPLNLPKEELNGLNGSIKLQVPEGWFIRCIFHMQEPLLSEP